MAEVKDAPYFAEQNSLIRVKKNGFLRLCQVRLIKVKPAFNIILEFSLRKIY